MVRLMKNKAMVTRVVSGAILLALIIFCGYIGSVPLVLFCGIAGTVGLYEIYSVVGVYTKGADKKENILAYVGLGATIIFYIILCADIIPYCALGTNFPPDMEAMSFFSMITAVEYINSVIVILDVLMVFVFIILMLVIYMAIYVFNFGTFTFEKVAYAFTGFVYVPMFMAFVYFTRILSYNGIYVFWLIFISAWVCDTFAYFTGVTLGKHRLAPVLSPKKSIEGSIGGVIGAVVVAFLFGYFIEYKIFGGRNNAVSYMIICAFGSVVSQIGDLCASGIKRNHNIKDYGNLIPGHGGIMDRFDSVIFVAPVIFILALLFI